MEISILKQNTKEYDSDADFFFVPPMIITVHAKTSPFRMIFERKQKKNVKSWYIFHAIFPMNRVLFMLNLSLFQKTKTFSREV